MKLQLLGTDVSSSLDDVRLQSLGTIPRSLRVIETLKKEASELKNKIGKNVNQQSKPSFHWRLFSIYHFKPKNQDRFVENLVKMEDFTVESLKFISYLDTLKSRIEEVTTQLSEAEKFSKIVNNIEATFQTKDFERVITNIYVLNSSKTIPKSKHRLQMK